MPPVSAPAVAVRKALTIKQPWAWAIAAGHKRIENRSWPTSFRGHLAIHTGKCPTQKYLRESRAIIRGLGVEPPVAEPARMFSHIVAVARIADCVRLADLPGELVGNPWAFGEWCWLLADVVPLPEPIPCSGGLSLWNLPTEISEQLEGSRSATPGRGPVPPCPQTCRIELNADDFHFTHEILCF